MKRPDLTIVVPALNERDRLPKSLERIHGYLRESADWTSIEIVVVDDGSSDGTAEIISAMSFSGATEVTVAVHPETRGKGAAVRTGFGLSSGAWVLLTDADLSAPIEGLELLKNAAHPGDVAIGSRAVERRLVETPQPRHRDLMGRVFNLIVRGFGLSRFRDTQCGFKLFPGDLARSLAAVQQIDGFAYDVELLLLAEHWGHAVREVGVPWHHVEASRVLPLRHSSEMLRDLLLLFWRRLTGQIPKGPANASSRGANV
jgi:dolichyl-phosphate beta-glucosyltransferase